MSKNIIPQGGDKPIQTPVGIGNTQKVIAISSEKVEGILNFMEEREIPLRKLVEYLECVGLDNTPEVIAQIKGNEKFILNSLKENFLNHQTVKMANKLIELTKTMNPKDALLTLDWGYDNSKKQIQKMFEEAQTISAKLMIEQSKDMKLDDTVEFLRFGIRHSHFEVQKLFMVTIVNLVQKLKPKEAMKILNKLTSFHSGDNNKIFREAIIGHSKLFVESVQKLEKPKDILEALDEIFYYSDEEKAKEILEQAMIEPAKSFIEQTKNMPQKGFWESLKGNKGNYIKNFIKTGFDILTKVKRKNDILETLEEGYLSTRGQARDILFNEIIDFIIENFEPQKALKILKQKQTNIFGYGREIPADKIIKLIPKDLGRFVTLSILDGWLDISFIAKNNVKYANAIIDYIISNFTSKQALFMLYIKSGNINSDFLLGIFREAMITSANSLIESTKNMPQKDALKKLRWGRKYSAGEAYNLFQEEIRYRSTVSELSQLIKN